MFIFLLRFEELLEVKWLVLECSELCNWTRGSRRARWDQGSNAGCIRALGCLGKTRPLYPEVEGTHVLLQLIFELHTMRLVWSSGQSYTNVCVDIKIWKTKYSSQSYCYFGSIEIKQWYLFVWTYVGFWTVWIPYNNIDRFLSCSR